MNKNHTRGPWKAELFFPEIRGIVGDDGEVWAYQEATIFGANGALLGRVNLSTSRKSGYPGVDNMDTFKANVALVQAAPKLLAACIAARQLDTLAEEHTRTEVLAMLDAAIADAMPEA